MDAQHAGLSAPAADRLVGFDGVDDLDLVVPISPVVAFAHQHRDGVATEALDELEGGHAQAAIERVDGEAVRRRQPVFAGGQRIGPHDFPGVFHHHHGAGAEHGQLLVDHGQRVVEVGPGEDAEHAVGDVVEPEAYLGHFRKLGTADAEAEPWTGRRGETGHQAERQGARRQHGCGIEELAIQLGAAIVPAGHAEERPTTRQDVFGQLAPMREPRGALTVERAQAPLAMAAEVGVLHVGFLKKRQRVPAGFPPPRPPARQIGDHDAARGDFNTNRE